MELQYISDNNGKHTAVVIPIEDWEILTKKHADLKLLETDHTKTTNKKKLSEILKGSISNETAEKLHLELKEMRGEWQRDTY
jgi:PHD/YefM family antitoxin component YafN of YafNO toxin-antitoxin module